jgi:GT2 family glycosyltransferase
MNFRVSIVIPTRNRNQDLISCLDSLADQSFIEPFEVIIIDDASTIPFSPDPNTSLNLKIFRSETNIGPAASRNIGVKISNSEIILFIDDDCTADRLWIEEMVLTLEEQGVSASGGKTTVDGTENFLIRYYKMNPPIRLLNSDHAGQQSLVSRFLRYVRFEILGYEIPLITNSKLFMAPTCNFGIRRKIFLQVGGFNEKIKFSGEDQDLCRRLNISGSGAIIYTKSAVVSHHYSSKISDLILRAKAYALGNAQSNERNGNRFPILYPVPVISGFIISCYLIDYFATGTMFKPQLILLIFFMYPKYWNIKKVRNVQNSIIFSFLQFTQEFVANITLIKYKLSKYE